MFINARCTGYRTEIRRFSPGLSVQSVSGGHDEYHPIRLKCSNDPWSVNDVPIDQKPDVHTVFQKMGEILLN